MKTVSVPGKPLHVCAGDGSGPGRANRYGSHDLGLPVFQSRLYSEQEGSRVGQGGTARSIGENGVPW